jgi:hypothetical protein
MYPNMFQALGESRIRDWHEQAARDRLVRQARRARREAAHAPARRPWLRAGFRPAEPVSAAPADERAAAVPASAGERATAVSAARADEQTAVSVGPADESAGAGADRQPVGCRAA